MQAIHSRAAGVGKTSWQWDAPIEATAAVLELTASEQPELLDFQAHVLCNSSMSFAVQKLAAAFDVPLEKVGPTVSRACKDLDRLENHRGASWEPAKILEAPNLAALLYLCKARLNRVQDVKRRLRLGKVLRRLKPAYDLARARAWVDDFIGPLPAKAQEAQGADR